MFLCAPCRRHLLLACLSGSAWPSAPAALWRPRCNWPSSRNARSRQWPARTRRHCAQASTAAEAHASLPGAPLHVPVLLDEVLSMFAGCHLPVFVDATLGAGGHSAALLAAHPELRRLVGVDVDPAALALARSRLEGVKAGSGAAAELALLQGNFAHLPHLLGEVPGGGASAGVNGILMDLGFSSMQVDAAERGFSFLRDGPLDMRLGPSAPHSAAEIVNGWSEEELGRIFRDYGEERYWRYIAQRIAEIREREPIETTSQLVSAIGSGSGRGQRRPGARHINPATRVFQALRIAVNDELRALEAALPAALDALAPGGRLAVITFHSLEDRIVKRAFLRAAGQPAGGQDAYMARRYLPDEPAAAEPARARLLTRRPLVAAPAEAAANPRSRSAKLRALEKL